MTDIIKGYDDYLSDVDITNIDSLQKFFQFRRDTISQSMTEYAEYFKDVVLLSKKQYSFYTRKQNVGYEKLHCMTLSNKFVKDRKEILRSLILAYKFKQKSPHTNHSSYTLTNNDDREAFYEADLKVYDMRIKLVDDHISFLTEQGDILKSMIYGFEIAIKFSEFKNI